MKNLTLTADYLSDNLAALGFQIMSQKSGAGLPLVAFRLPKDTEGERSYDEFALAHQSVPSVTFQGFPVFHVVGYSRTHQFGIRSR